MELNFRFATIREAEIYFNWANDPDVRKFSFNSKEVSFPDHIRWFENKLLSKNCFLYYFTFDGVPAGQVRIEKTQDETVIGVSVDKQFRGRSLSAKMLRDATGDFMRTFPGDKITAYIKIENEASYRGFKSAGFVDSGKVTIQDCLSYKLTNNDQQR